MNGIEGNYSNSYYNSTVLQQAVINDKNQKNENLTISIDASDSKISAENKMKQADDFLAQHDKLYAEQQAAINQK